MADSEADVAEEDALVVEDVVGVESPLPAILESLEAEAEADITLLRAEDSVELVEDTVVVSCSLTPNDHYNH